MVEEAVSVFLEAAELEYTRLTSYADALSRLSHAVASATKRNAIDQVGLGGSQQHGFSSGGSNHASDGINFMLGDQITSAFQASELPHAASTMFDQIEAVRDSHAFLLDSLDDVVLAINEEDAVESRTDSITNDKEEDGTGANACAAAARGTHVPERRYTGNQRKLLQIHSILKDHAELSQRVVKTVCSSGVGVPIIHSNGILATEETNDDGTVTQHQNRIVALAALRASFARMKDIVPM
jgi:hypothetical protein